MSWWILIKSVLSLVMATNSCATMHWVLQQSKQVHSSSPKKQCHSSKEQHLQKEVYSSSTINHMPFSGLQKQKLSADSSTRHFLISMRSYLSTIRMYCMSAALIFWEHCDASTFSPIVL